MKSLTTPEGRKTSFGYDDAGQLVTVVEPNGNASGATASDWTWTYAYDAAGNRTSEAHPDGGTRAIAYDALNRPFEWTDALNHVTSVEYDANSNVIKQTNALGKFRTQTYDKLNRVVTESDERGKTWTYTYHGTGELESVTTPASHLTTYDLDDDGRVTSMVEPRGYEFPEQRHLYRWFYGYDEAGNRTTVTDPLGNSVAYAYDALDNLADVTDENGNTTSFAYDVMNRLWKVTPEAAGASGTLHTEYSYDARGNLASRTDPNNNTTTWTHDLDGLLTQRTTPVGTWNYTYFPNGTLKTLEKPSGSATQTAGDGTITYGYDRMSRRTNVDYSDTTPDVTRTYDLAGRPASMTDGAGGTVAYTFDNADRLTEIARTGASAGLNGAFQYGYDDAGNITSRTYPDSTTATATYTDEGRVASVSSGGATTTFGYDEAGNLTTTTLPSGNGHVISRTFDYAGRLTSVGSEKSGTSLSRFLWTLDNAGNPTKMKTTRGSTDTYDVNEYDTRNRLTASCFTVASSATTCTGATNKITYAYDKVTNRSQEVRTGSVGNTGTIDYTYNSADQLTSTTKGGTTTTYTYDGNGNAASAGGRTFTYDLADHLVSTAHAGTTTTYGYDGDGRRVSSTVGGGGADVRSIWDPLAATGIADLALERTSAGGLVRRYLGGPLGAISMTNASASFYYHHDPLGTVNDVTDASGAPQWKYEYEGYGGERSAINISGSAPENRLRFNGQHLDPETALYHLRARQYDAATGRFGGLDPVESPPIAAYTASYVYVNGRPAVLIDPVGLWPSLSDVKDAAVGTVKAGGTTAAGALDGATGGLSTVGLNAVGIRPDEESFAFKAGRFGGTVATVATGGGLAVKAAGRVGAAAAGRTVAAGAGGATANITLGVTRAAVGGRPYGATDAATDAVVAAIGGGTGYAGVRCVTSVVGRWPRGTATAADDFLPTPMVRDQKLKNLVHDLYKGTTNPNRVGTGTTADAVRYELATGQRVAGKSHIQKAADTARGLRNWLARNPGADAHDRLVGQSLYDELVDALGRTP